MSRVSDDFSVQLATRSPDWSAGGLLQCTMLPVCPCVVSFSTFHEPDTHDMLPTSRWHPRSSLVRPISSRHVSDGLARMSRGCYEETVPVEFPLMPSSKCPLAGDGSSTRKKFSRYRQQQQQQQLCLRGCTAR